MTAGIEDLNRELCSAQQGYVHSIETGGTLDGPGIRFVLFLNGCPLRCQYCHNPDTWLLRHGKLTPTQDILKELESYASFLKRAKGGLTISGGEPLMQPRFAEAIFKGAKDMGLHTTLDTSGALHDRSPDSFFDQVDLVLLDLKGGDDETHRLVTRKPLQPTLDFAERLKRLDKPIWARFVLVPGLNNSETHLRKIAKIISGWENVKRVEILPFHQMASYKYDELGVTYPLEGKAEATARDVTLAWHIFSEEGVYNTRNAPKLVREHQQAS
ncbi:pyruvate formate-lyase-activating protein [Kiritimatiellota bacterium B12222]|nr:pyruvate formate-lyase-activating protein [Kiritimatiellota bacterium B12222]